MEDDIARALPQPPPPAPARREAAIEAALQRFDAPGDQAVSASPAHSDHKPSPWWRPQTAALVSATLVAVIGIPVAWMSIDLPSGPDGRRQRVAQREHTVAPVDSAGDVAVRAPDPVQPVPVPKIAAPKVSVDTAKTENGALMTQQLPAPPPPAALATPAPPAPIIERRAPGMLAATPEERVVTGSRIVRAELADAQQKADESVVVTGTRRSRSRAPARGDWNACTIEDPEQDLGRCRRLVDSDAKGEAGRADAQIAKGLSRAWADDDTGAITAFDAAIAIRPRAAFAYLNRGLAHERNGDGDRALADFNRAVSLAPHSARGYYHRSRLLRERGETRRADRDAQRAMNLDPRYAELID